jgi:hypothetical protein
MNAFNHEELRTARRGRNNLLFVVETLLLAKIEAEFKMMGSDSEYYKGIYDTLKVIENVFGALQNTNLSIIVDQYEEEIQRKFTPEELIEYRIPRFNNLDD